MQAMSEKKPEKLDCPRCGKPLNEKLYGPCLKCRQELREAALEQGAFRRFLYGMWPQGEE